MKENENGTSEFTYYHKPEKIGKWKSFKKALYDPATRTIFGRTKKNWGQLLLFYTIFYIVLAALCAICMQGLLSTLDDNEPTWKLGDSLIGSNPGLGFRPISDKTEEGSLIWYNTKNETTTRKWVDLLDKFLDQYKANQTGKNFQNCDFDKKPDPGFVCTVDLDKFGPCSPKHSYGYTGSSPCVFLKLNKIYGWTPDFYTSSEANMPDDLVETINRMPPANKTQVWISCEGEGPVDKEHVSVFNFFPNRGFPGFYYPFTNTENYLSPLIAVQVNNPTPNVLISIECRAWAKNINYRGGNLQREGSIHFEILQDVK